MSIGAGKISTKARGDTLAAAEMNAYDVALDRCAECSSDTWPERESVEGERQPHVFNRTIHQGTLSMSWALNSRVLPWFSSSRRVECGQLRVHRTGTTSGSLQVVSYASEWLTDHNGVVDPGELLDLYDVGVRVEFGWKWSWPSGNIFRIRIPPHALCEGATMTSIVVYTIAPTGVSTDFTGALGALASNTTTPAIATAAFAAGSLVNNECLCAIDAEDTVVDKTWNYFVELRRVGAAALNVHYIYKIAISYADAEITPAQRYLT